MAITRALEFDQTPNKMLFEIGEQARQQQLMQQKLEAEHQEKIFQVYQGVGPAALYSKYNKLVVNQRIVGLQKKLSDYQKQNPSANYLNLQFVANQELGEIAQQSAGIEAMDSDIDKWISGMDQKSPYDKSRLRALARNEAFYEEDGRTLRSNFDGLKVDDIMSSVIQKHEDKVIDPFKGQQAMKDAVNDASLYTENIEETVETPNGRMTVFKGKKSSVPFFLEVGDNKLRVKQQKDGYVDEGVFKDFYNNPAIRANINAEAKSNMQKIGVPESPEAFEYFKRAYLTTWLENNKKGLFDKVDKTLYEKPSAGFTVNLGPTQPYRKAFAELKKNVIGDDFVSGKLSDTSPTILEYITSIANKQGKRAKVGLKYTIDDLDVREDSYGYLKIYDKSSNKEIATLNEKDFDQEYNKGAFGAQAAGNASGVNWK